MLEKIKENKRKIIIICIIVILIAFIISMIVIRKNSNNKIMEIAKAETEYGYDKPYIPEGFNFVEGTWDEGYVIQETATGNQFVWIPVDGQNVKLQRREFSVSEKKKEECSEELDEVFEDSVNKYGGYYVARFEAGVPTNSQFETDEDMNVNGKPVSKKGSKVWNNISYLNAKTSAEQMYATKAEITSSLMNSYAYDTMLTWLESHNYNVETDCKDWGNYSDNTETNHQVELAGAKESWKANNIYDLAGNVSEWTSEEYSTIGQSGYIYRGGSYYNDGNITPASMREFGNETKIANNLGFRVIMYKTGNATIEGYNDPYIPKGFSHTEGDWDTGFVIKEDSTDNEFVWIPVDGYNLNLDRSEFEKTFTTMGKSTDTLAFQFKISVYTHGGFYVSRYEAGVGETRENAVGVPVSKKNAEVWTNISRGNAIASAEKMYEDNGEISSKLINSYAYDTMLNWLKITDYSKTTYNVDTDSTSWGNYGNDGSKTKAVCGSNDAWKANNIYDLAGNVWELTTESYNDEAVVRGGDYLSNGDVLPAGARDHASAKTPFDYTGFRILMYKASGEPGRINPPKLAEGMTPVKWTGTEWQETTADDEEWYDYENKLWANVKLQDGSMFVWIPRYAYNISSNWHTEDVENINIMFLKGTSNRPITGESIKMSTTSGQNNWLVHPAFSYGDTQIEGIWIAKYLASVTENKILIKEDSSKTDDYNISDIYQLCISMNDEQNLYGLSSDDNIVDPHLLKNTEWGAMEYLTHSKYGRNKSVTLSSSFYKSTDDLPENSTTGNENGIYNTCAYSRGRMGYSYGFFFYYDYNNEIVAAYIDNGDQNLITEGEKLINAPNKHKDVYKVAEEDTYENNYNENSNKYGDAIYETSNGCNAPQLYPYTNNPFFYRNEVKNYMFAYTTGNTSGGTYSNSIRGAKRLDKDGNPSSTGTLYNVIYHQYKFYTYFRPSIVVY